MVASHLMVFVLPALSNKTSQLQEKFARPKKLEKTINLNQFFPSYHESLVHQIIKWPRISHLKQGPTAPKRQKKMLWMQQEGWVTRHLMQVWFHILQFPSNARGPQLVRKNQKSTWLRFRKEKLQKYDPAYKVSQKSQKLRSFAIGNLY